VNESNITAEWTGSDNISGIDFYEVRTDSNNWTDVGNDLQYTFTNLSDGDHTIEAKAWDNAGNSRTDTTNLTIDTTPPQIDINEPLENEAFDVDEVTLKWNGNDATTGIDHYEVRLDNGSWIDKGNGTNHTFSNLAEGEHTAEVRGWDNAGNNRIENVNFTVDKTPPDIEITSPTESEIVNESDITAEWTGSDNISGIDYYEVRIDNGSWIAVGNDTSYTFMNILDGNHTIEVEAWDTAGNNATDMVNFTVDTSLPGVNITEPQEDELFDVDEVIVKWNGSDEITEVDYYEVRLDGGNWTYVGANTNHTFSNLSSDEHLVEVKVYDLAGNHDDDSVNFTVDTAPPEINITQPEEGEMINEDSVTIQWTGDGYPSGIDYYEVRRNNGSWSNVGTDTQYAYSNMGEGVHVVDVRATDNAGNSAIETVNFTIDTVPPDIQIDMPGEGDILTSADVTVGWNGSDDRTGIDYYEVRLDGINWTSVGNETEYIFENVSDGEHTVEVRAWDKAGNSETKMVNFTVDATPPVLEILEPQENQYIDHDEVTVEWNATDNTTGIDYFEVRLDGGNWIDVGTDTNYTFSNLDDGEHTVDVKAWDKAGNNHVESVTFTVDTTPPSVSVDEPGENEILTSSNVTVNWIATDDTSGIDYYEINIDENNWTLVGNGTEYIFENVSDGDHTVEVRAWDGAGNNHTHMVNFTVDSTPPVLEILEPQENQYIDHDEVTVEWNASDNTSGIDLYEVRIDGGNWIDVGTDTNYTFSNLDDGEHTVDVKAWDKGGNNNTDSVIFTVDTTSPSVDLESPGEGDVLEEDSITVNWSGSDDTSGIDHYEVKLDSGDWVDVGTNMSHVLEDLLEEEHTVVVKGIDKAGNDATDDVNFTIDLPPSANIISPEEGEVHRKPDLTVEWKGYYNITDMDYYEIKKDSGSWTNVGTSTSYTFQDIAEGPHSIRVRIIDDQGRSGTDEVNFTVDTTSIYVEITSPDEDSILGEDQVMIEWFSNNASYHEIRLDGGLWNDVGSDTSHTFPGLSDGSHMVDVRAVNSTETHMDSVNFTVDTAKPYIDIITPVENEVFTMGDVTVEWSGGDDTSGIDHYEIRINGEDWIDVGTYTNHTFVDVEDGNRTVEVRAWDEGGNNATDVVNFIVDKTPPDLNITAPQEGENFDIDEITVLWNATDETMGVDFYEVRIDGNNWTDKGNYTNHTFYDLAEGEHTVEVRAWDTAGNNQTAMVNFTVDITLPEVNIGAPADGEVIPESDITVEWTGSDDVSGIDFYEVRLDTQDWIDVGTDTEHTFQGVEDGNHTVEVRAWDNASNFQIDSADFTVDATPPEIDITTPDEGESFNTDDVTVGWAGNDSTTGIDFYEVKIDGQDWIDMGNDTEYTFTGLEDGEHTVKVRAWDNASNYNTQSVTFTVDTTAPEVDIVAPPQDETLSERDVTVEWEGNDTTTGIDLYEVRIDGWEWIDVGTDTEYNLSDLEDGEHTVEVRAWDLVGNYDSDIVDFYVDASSPEIEVTSPDESEHFASDSVTVEWGGIDETSGIDYYDVQIDNGNWVNVGSATNHTFSNLTDGEHLVKVRAWDNAGNNNTGTVNFTVDTTSPELNIIAPQQNEIFSESNVTMEWEGNDSTTGVGLYEIRIDSDDWINMGTDTEYTFTGLQDGEHTVELRASDEVGNHETMSVDFTVDTTPPEIEIISPGDGETLNETEVTIEWSGEDGGTSIDHYKVRIDDGSWNEVGSDTSYTFSELEEGEHTVEVQAVDGAGNLNSVSVDFEVSVEEEEPMIVVHDFAVEPTEGEAPLTVNITAEIENEGTAPGEISLYIDDEEIETWTIEADEVVDVDMTHTFEEAGDFDVTLGEESVSVDVEEESVVEEYTIIVGPIKDQDDNRIDDAEVSISWGDDQEDHLSSGTNGFYNFTIELTEHPDNIEFTCTVDHDSLEEPITEEFTGNESGEIIIEFEEDGGDGEDSEMFLIEYWWLFIPIVILLIVLIILILVFKKKEDEPKEPQERPVPPENGRKENFEQEEVENSVEPHEGNEVETENSIPGSSREQEQPDTTEEEAIPPPPEEKEILSLLEGEHEDLELDEEFDLEEETGKEEGEKNGEEASNDEDPSQGENIEKLDGVELKKFVRGRLEELLADEDDVDVYEVMDKVMDITEYQDNKQKMKNIIYAELSFYSGASNEKLRQVSEEISERAVGKNE
ncbi:MAG: Ig-like domain-containing protein, partial [Candidatus Aenigmatarchaeota archaeon]